MKHCSLNVKHKQKQKSNRA